MKNIFKIFAASAITLLSLAACSKEDSYKSGEPEVDGCYGVYFPSQEASGSHTYDPTAEKSITVSVARSNSNGAITVPVEVSSNVEGVFNVAPISFANGQSETTAEITFPNIENGVNSTVSLTITDNQYASKYGTGAISIDISIMCVEWIYLLDPATGEKATVHWTQDWWGEEVDTYIKYYEIDGVRHAQTETLPDTHLYNGEYYSGYGFWGTGETEDEGIEWSFLWYATSDNGNGGNWIHIPYQNTGYYNSSYSEFVYIYDFYSWYYDDYTDAKFLWFANSYGDPAGSYPVSYYDGNGGFYFSEKAYYMPVMGGGWQPDPYDNVGIASGFVRTDYSIKLDTDFATEGQLPVYLELGADVDEVRYGVYEGSLTAGQIANKITEISDGGQTGSYTVDENSGFSLSLDETGVYTIVALSYADGTYQEEYASASFNYVSAADAGTYAPVITIGTEDTSARYAGDGYDKTNSFGFFIVGSDLTEVHVAAIATAAYTSDKESYNAAIKSTTQFTLSADELAAVNDIGGYADLVIGLSANTSYTLLVYATNGQQETWATAEYTTDGLPNKVLADGTGAYDYAQMWGVVAKGYNLEYNPNTGMYEIPDWCYGVTFTFSVDEDGSINVPIQSTGFSNSTYGTVYVMTASLVDTFFGEEGVADYFGYDTTSKSYINEDGTYCFNVAYCSTKDYGMGAGYEYFYPDGVPTESVSAASVQSMKVSKASLQKAKAKAAVKASSTEPRIAGVDYSFESAKAVRVKVSTLTATRTPGRNSEPKLRR